MNYHGKRFELEATKRRTEVKIKVDTAENTDIVVIEVTIKRFRL
jgi:hypothetical protein